MAIKLSVGDANLAQLKPRITVIGVGGGGGNAITNMMSKNLEGVDFVVANTDAQALALNPATRKIQLGLEITQGLGAGARPEIGRLAAEEAREDIEREIASSNMVFITAGMGGGTGSGAAPVVAKIAKEKGILTVGVVTKPFAFEGKKRMENAESALETFINEVDSIIVIPNQNLFRIADKNTTLKDAFVKADEVLYDGVRSITDLMIMPGLINLDFADVKKIMADKGKAIMGTGEAEGEDRARIAAEQALSNPILDDCSMKGAKGVLINITGGSDITLMEIDEAVNIIKEEVDENAELIFGSSYDDSLSGRIRVSIVVTGIDEDAQVQYLKNKEMNNYVSLNNEVELEEEKIEEEVVVNEDVVVEEKEGSVEVVENIEEETTQANDNIINLSEVKGEATQGDLLEEKLEDDEPTRLNSSLFNAIINKPIVANAEEESEDVKEELSVLKNDKPFVPSSKLKIVEEEPELFPDHGEVEFPFEKKKREEQVKLEDEEEQVKPARTFLDKILGRSHSNKVVKPMQMVAPKFEEIEDFADKANDDDDLEIPSFLRRR
ncbi:MAG: cell division protein FtsZ [Alphaproteobacteria bacterium]|nr:cell division protein FtsZ [Alphaproteobacteria bacterium]